MKEKLKKFAKISNYKIIALCIVVIIAVIYYYEDFKEVEVTIPMKDVVVLINDIPENTIVKQEMVTLERRYQEDVLKEGNIAISFNEVVGKRTKVPLYKGELIKVDRLIINEEHMNGVNLKTDIAFQLNDTDRALNLKKGNYIDIWLEPTDLKSEILPQKIFKKLRIKETVNQNKEEIDKEKESSDAERKIASYIIISLTDFEIDTLYNIDKTINNIRIARYSEEDFYNVVNQVLINQTNNEGSYEQE